MAKWIGVDLDGTLARSNSSIGTKIGPPVTPMLNRVKGWLGQGQEVRIFTARRLSQAQISELKRWLDANHIPGCGITNSKDLDLLELWDDKAVRVEKDTGRPCAKCKPQSSRNSASGEQHASHFSQPILTDC